VLNYRRQFVDLGMMT